jgi:hypothetical protein
VDFCLSIEQQRMSNSKAPVHVGEADYLLFAGWSGHRSYCGRKGGSTSSALRSRRRRTNKPPRCQILADARDISADKASDRHTSTSDRHTSTGEALSGSGAVVDRRLRAFSFESSTQEQKSKASPPERPDREAIDSEPIAYPSAFAVRAPEDSPSPRAASE